MDYVLRILRKRLKQEKYFGTSAVVKHTGGKIAAANQQMVKDRIPQLEKAIEILTGAQLPVTSNRKRATKSDNQLNLF